MIGVFRQFIKSDCIHAKIARFKGLNQGNKRKKITSDFCCSF